MGKKESYAKCGYRNWNSTMTRPDNPAFPHKFAEVMTRAVRRIRAYHYSTGANIRHTQAVFAHVHDQLVKDLVLYRIFREETITVEQARAMPWSDRAYYVSCLGYDLSKCDQRHQGDG